MAFYSHFQMQWYFDIFYEFSNTLEHDGISFSQVVAQSADVTSLGNAIYIFCLAVKIKINKKLWIKEKFFTQYLNNQNEVCKFWMIKEIWKTFKTHLRKRENTVSKIKNNKITNDCLRFYIVNNVCRVQNKLFLLNWI